MVGLGQLLGFGLAAFVVIVIPGPSVLFAVGRAISYGPRVALATVIGNSTGLAVIMCLVIAGLGAIVARSDAVFVAIKLAGAAYLVYLGVQSWRHRKELQLTTVEPRAPMTVRRAVGQGFVVGLTNPKGFMIFAALLPPFVDRSAGAPPATEQMLMLGWIAVVIGVVSDSIWAFVAGRARDWFASSPQRVQRLGAIGGTSMIGLGIGLALTGRGD
ncbi:MAG: LysE family translocator [Nocardioidaceae bacterium]|nr:LysE family translocator [Nocardioidaceae bacterium]MCL2612006.1 LysE family translocator [Nocardioidaceae bacterium]